MEKLTYGDTTSLENFLRSLEPELLVCLVDDYKFLGTTTAETDEIIKEIICSELSIHDIDNIEDKWRHDFMKSVYNEIKIRYEAIATSEKHSSLIGYCDMKFAVKDHMLLEEINEDHGRIYTCDKYDDYDI